MARNFVLGSGIAASIIREIECWLQDCGVPSTAKIKGRPVAAAVFKRLLNRFGVVRCHIARRSLFVLMPDKSWKQIVHRDDVHAWLFGRKVDIKVGKEPDPAERGIKVRVGIMEAKVEPGKDGRLGTEDDKVTIAPTTKIDGKVEYEEIEDAEGKTIYKCEACGLERKTERGIVNHIERDH